tara:strand:- start:1224 stop:1559 length:336 start_codon:yes stop_codon:yes gene_type:complete
MNYSAKETAVYGYYQGDRKPSSFEDVQSIIDFKSLQTREKYAFSILNVVDAENEYIKDPFSDIAEVWADTQYFILQFGSELYFIDTQGYNYCRYVAKIVNFEGELPLFFPM